MTGRNSTSATDWFDTGLEILKDEGPEGLKLRPLSRRLGVTTGSFYWHFDSMQEFQQKMLDYWVNWDTTRTTQEAKQSSEPLSALERLIEDKQLLEYDDVVRRWAQTNDIAARTMDRVDKMRVRRVSQILMDMGMDSDTAIRRAQLFHWTAIQAHGEPIAWRHRVLRELVELISAAVGDKSADQPSSGSGGL